MTGSSGAPSPAVRAFVLWTLRNGRLLWTLALLAGVPATVRTASLYLHLRSDVEQLLPREAPSVRALDEMRARSPGLHFLGVVAEVPDGADLPAAERFLDDLAGRIRAYPPDMVLRVRSNRAAERAFVEKHAPLYLDLPDLQEIRRRIETRRDHEASREEGTPAIDISDIEKRYEHKIAGEEGDHLSSAELRATVLAVEAGDLTTGAVKDRRLLDRVRGDVAALGPDRYVRGLRVGYASDVAINVEELDGLEADLSFASVLVVLAVMAAIVVYFRWWPSVPVLMLPLFLATVYAFAIASLPPMSITELNTNTAFLGSIIVGNGVNVGLVLLARYREERLRGTSVEEAIVIGVWGARVGTLAAAMAAAVSYGSLVVTEFRGFRQFGCIGGIGMLASWATAFLLVPPLLRWLDEGKPAPSPVKAQGWVMRGIVRVVERRAPLIVAAAVAITVASAFEATRFDSSRLESDFNKLRRADTWQSGEGLWGRKMDEILGRYLTPTVVLCATPEQARAVERRVRESVDHGVLRPMVARVVSVEDVLPSGQEAKIEEVDKLRRALTPEIRSRLRLSSADREKLDNMLGNDRLVPIRAEDLPSSFTTGMRERDGSMGRTILVYPQPSGALWKADSMHLFVQTLRDLGALESSGGPVFVAGSIPLSSDILVSIGRDAPIASLVSLLGVVAVVVVVLRSRKASIHVIGSLLVGVLWLVGGAMALGIKINYANFIAFPITFGIGVDYAVNVMSRYVQDSEHDVRGAVCSTGSAVALCSLTTILGYSSLLLARNRALFTFGLLAVLGEIACLTAAVVALPAWLVLRCPPGSDADTVRRMKRMGGIELAVGKAQYRAFTGVLRLMAGLRHGSAVIEGVRVPYLVRRRPASLGPAARVPIVLVHGFGADKEGWLMTASKLGRQHSLVIPDLPGFGAAGAITKQAASAAAQARVLAALLEQLGYPRVHLVGSSMGGGISLRFARDFPERTASMTLIGSAGPIVEKSELVLALDRGENHLLTNGPDDFERLLHFVAESPPPVPRATLRYLGAERYARRDALALAWDGWVTPPTTEGIPQELESITTPALVIQGDRDRVIHPSTGKALAARLPNARLELLEGVGHLPMMEKPKVVAALVERFVASVA